MNEIEPCPFCDSKARVKIRKGYKTKYGIGCSNEDCIIWLPDDVLLKELQNYTTVYSELEEAIKAWNRRPKSNWISVKEKLEKAIKDVHDLQMEAMKGPDEILLLKLENIYDVIRMIPKVENRGYDLSTLRFEIDLKENVKE